MKNTEFSMDKMLYSLFDFQKFMQNKDLDSEIQNSTNSVCTSLSENDLAFINAAGVNNIEKPKEKK